MHTILKPVKVYRFFTTALSYFWPMKLLIIDNYDSFTYNLLQLVEQAGVTDFVFRKNDQLLTLEPNSFQKILISPGPGLASEAGQLLPFLHSAIHTKSILGICLGYEALAEVLGAQLKQLKKPLHGIRSLGEVTVQHPIFKGLPDQFFIGHYHSWIADEQTFPDSLQVIMRDQDGDNMAFCHTGLPLTGLLFHPESVMTDHGLQLIENWLSMP